MIQAKTPIVGGAYRLGMARYFFDIYNDETIIDEEGLELPDAAAAMTRATMEVRVLASETVREKGRIVLDHRIEVTDECGAEIGVVRFGDAVEIK